MKLMMMSDNSGDMQSELERLRAENAALKKTSAKGLSLKVSAKGALSVYGLGRFPVTLYKEQWKKLLDMADDLRAFMAANDSQLKTKETAGAAASSAASSKDEE
jgi:hypothetical protein